MAWNLAFYYWAMWSSKTADALMKRFNYIQKGMNPLLLKPRCENRDWELIIRSRIWLEAECWFVEEFIERYKADNNHVKQYDAIIIDEAQFMTPEQVDLFSEIVDEYNIDILCFWLRTDFQSKLFQWSARLFELAEKLIECTTVCWCWRKARFNVRVSNWKVVRDWEQVVLGWDDNYISVCRKHFKSGEVYPTK